MEKDILNKPGKKSSTKSKKSKILTDNDIMKYEIASELGLIDKVTELGWAGLTAKEAGKAKEKGGGSEKGRWNSIETSHSYTMN